MKSTNLTKTLAIEGGDTVRFSALSENARIDLQGTGDIVMEVSVDGVNYAEVTHSEVFVDGRCIAPIKMYIGDFIRISATTLTQAIINFNCVNENERA